jgi:DNA-binding NtrC family response regulator
MSILGVPTRCASTVLQTQRILDLVATAQRSDPRVPLLIRGERGVGKDVVARLIHAASGRQPYSFIKVNCGVQALDRCAADLFGHERGSGPLPLRRRPGSFEYANHGTIYLDEIAALPHDLVPSLVRVLRTGEVLRAGGGDIRRVDARVIASTTLGAETGIQDEFGQELCRLNAVEIPIPPLRERMGEIAVFASFFWEQFNCRYRGDVQLCPEVMATFRTHSWPGNVRELEEAVHRLVTGASHGSRSLADRAMAP